MATITKTRTPRQARAKAPRKEKAPEPASGTVRVLRPVGSVNEVTGGVAINGKAYYLQLFNQGYRLTGWDERKAEPTVYDLPADLSSCDCPDAEFRARPGGCKHRRALAALRGAGKLPDCPGEYKPGPNSQIPF
jgi:hypothetical protein